MQYEVPFDQQQQNSPKKKRKKKASIKAKQFWVHLKKKHKNQTT